MKGHRCVDKMDVLSSKKTVRIGKTATVIARAVRPVAISRYNLSNCGVGASCVPGDCQIATLVTMIR